MRSAVASVFLTAASVSHAQAVDAWAIGRWCEQFGETVMLVEETGVGFGEHTICQWLLGPPEGAMIDTTINCANVYPNDGDTVRMDEKRVALHIAPADADSISVGFDGASATIFERCD